MTAACAAPTVVSLATAAAELQTTPLNVLLHLKRGVLLGRATGDDWEIEGESLAALLRQRGGARGAAVCRSGCAHAADCAAACR